MADEQRYEWTEEGDTFLATHGSVYIRHSGSPNWHRTTAESNAGPLRGEVLRLAARERELLAQVGQMGDTLRRFHAAGACGDVEWTGCFRSGGGSILPRGYQEGDPREYRHGSECKVTALLSHPDAQKAAGERKPCTGVAASWCPNCGDCTCKRSVGEGEYVSFDNPACPLHGPDSDHAEEELRELEQASLDDEKAAGELGELRGKVAYWKRQADLRTPPIPHYHYQGSEPALQGRPCYRKDCPDWLPAAMEPEKGGA